MRCAGYPSVVKCVGRVGAFFCHYLAPFHSEMGKEGLDRLVGVSKVVFIEFLDILVFDTVDDALDADVGARDSCSPPQAVVLTGATIWAICSVIRSIASVVGWPTMVSCGLADMIRLTVVWTVDPPADE